LHSSQAVRLLSPAHGLVVVAGLTGCGKTDVLHGLAADGEQVLDLEGLACHRGSAFGGIGLPAQPSHRAFVRTVRRAVAEADAQRVLWVEDEGQFIGRVGLPVELFDRLSRAPIVELRAPFESRVARIVATYARPGWETELEAAIARSHDRLGATVVASAMAALRAGELASAVRLLLPAYDQAYAHRVARRPRELLGVVEVL
jgi:tRNA 2-selenouridine synthase